MFMLTQPNPTHDILNVTQPNPSQLTFRNTVLRNDTVNSLGYNLQHEPKCQKCLTATAACGVSEIVYQSTTHAHLSKTVHGSRPYTYRWTEILCHLR